MPGKPTNRESSWKLEDAKARFSEVVRLAQSNGAKHATVRGHESGVVIRTRELDRLTQAAPPQPFVRRWVRYPAASSWHQSGLRRLSRRCLLRQRCPLSRR